MRRYTLAVIAGLDDGRLATVDISLSAAAGAVGAAIVVVAFTALAIRKLTTHGRAVTVVTCRFRLLSRYRPLQPVASGSGEEFA